MSHKGIELLCAAPRKDIQDMDRKCQAFQVAVDCGYEGT